MITSLTKQRIWDSKTVKTDVFILRSMMYIGQRIKKIILVCILGTMSHFCFAQAENTILVSNKNDTSTCFVLTKEYIKDIETTIDSTDEFYYSDKHCVTTILLSSKGARKISAITSNTVNFMQLDNIPIKIPIFLKYSSIGPVFGPIIYGYDWDGHFILDTDNQFEIRFYKSFLLQHPDFLEQLQHLTKQ